MAVITNKPPDYDIIIVGAGFAGVTLLYHLRKQGHRCLVLEAGSDLGGTWFWNRYPGARVDTEAPFYALSIPEIWNNWKWSEKFPSQPELRRYFAYLDKVLGLKQDIQFNTRVTHGQFRGDRWHTTTEDGSQFTSQFLIACPGPGTVPHIPSFPGLELFKGTVAHSYEWPEEGFELKGKRAAVIGTGASGLQIVQDWAKRADHLTVFQRTPNTALPMHGEGWLQDPKMTHEEFCHYRRTHLSGVNYQFAPTNTFDTKDPAERQAFREHLWKTGGFPYVYGNYKDVMINRAANREMYDFWAQKVRSRIEDPRKRDLLAPLEPLHPMGAKRPTCELDYYDQFNRSNVDLVDLRSTSIDSFQPDGLTTTDGQFYPLDIIALATGFDMITGGLTHMGLHSVEGKPLKDEWKSGVKTYLGMTINGYPNLFFLAGPQGPLSFSSGPIGIEVQCGLICDAIKQLLAQGSTVVEPTVAAQETWSQHVKSQFDGTLFLDSPDSWFLGGNIPGKKRELLTYAAGLPQYQMDCEKAFNSWDGFVCK
ncbi:uncharacterized protein EAE98_002427 [Botrytis deweyae]|uniref:FAD/NAD(P)-binding domain-containing protein n=1 Tax=Botrytis deweyae TaxID=2478750 RepID=A0ABQ7IXA9_9HELO|nr:uncharacterized protein EAE98_002427 [Botrytis deweyae]KAF7936208.1 hypothetical protein EAE98_002427 [Botrytis deweyae]